MKWCMVAFRLNEMSTGGVRNKIESQRDALSTFGQICDICYVESTTKRFTIVFRYGSEMKEYPIDAFFDEISKYDVLYIRWAGADVIFNGLLKEASHNKKIRIIVEIPTYPVLGEMMGKAKARWKNHKYLGALKGMFGGILLQYCYIQWQKKKVDIFVFTSNTKTLRGVKCVNIENGVNVKAIRIREKTVRSNDKVRFLIVANVSIWHGVDRLIRGIYECQNKKNIELYIVGTGSEINNLKELTRKLKLENEIYFEGLRMGKELDRYFELCDIAVGSLGLHRLSIKPSSLKSREYAARGIPFVISSTETFDIGDMVSDYIYLVEGNEENIKVDEIIEWYAGIDLNKAKIELREYAENHYSWEVQMRKVYEKLK